MATAVSDAKASGARREERDAKAVAAHVDAFGRHMKTLIRDLARRFPNDAMISRIQKRANLAAEMTPTWLIEEVGPMLFEYNEQIYTGDAAFFIENDYDREFRSAVNAEKIGMAKYLIPMIKRAWNEQLTEAEKGQYITTIQDLLDEYMEYLDAK
jgi:hypothetical protein